MDDDSTRHDGEAAPAAAGADDAAKQLRALARPLLLAARFDDYRRLFSQAEEIEDRHRRYWARRELIVQGLASVSRAPRRRAAPMLSAIAEMALAALEPEPAEPLLLNYAGVALYELWSLDAAERLFEAARRLDPQLPQVEGNLAEVAQRREQPNGGKGLPHIPGLARLASQAIEIADRAQPGSGLRLSLCMIVRDEQDMLPRSLQAAQGAVDEIVVVDTGSRDRTIEIARSFGAKVIEREWTGSFSDARNASFDAASGDWILYLDADEVLISEDAGALRELTGRTWREAFYLSETNYTGDIDMGTAVTHNALRMFRNRSEYRFRGRLHEQIAHSLPSYLSERLESTSVRVEHFGYLSAVHESRDKSRRNIELLRLQQQDGVDTPFLHFNLGSEHAAAGDPAAALHELERAWELLEGHPERDSFQFSPSLAKRLTQALRACGRAQEAIEFADGALERFAGFTDLVLEQAVAHVELGEREQAIACFERCIEMGDAPRSYTATVGAGSYLPRLRLAEMHIAEGDTERAAQLLERSLEEHPRFVGTVLPFATALLACGQEPEQVVATVERLLGEVSPAARFLLGTALYERGASQAGEQQFRTALQQQPHSSRARVALGEALLAQRRYAEAAQATRELDVEDPLAAMSCRTELFASIVSGAPAGELDAAFSRAHAAGLPAREMDLFSSWRTLASGGSAEAELDRAATSLLGVILEALLRVQEFKAFEVLLALLEATPLSERERRQMLAEMYLRRGFAASAAEEWMAVCRQQPDVPALLGLAAVAEQQGMAPQAVDFARAALERDPDNETALQLLDRCAAPTCA